MRRREFIAGLSGAVAWPRDTGAAAGNAGDRVSQQWLARPVPAAAGCIRPRTERRRVYRGPERRHRESLGGWSIRSATRAGGGSGSPPRGPAAARLTARVCRALLIILHSRDLSIHYFVISYWRKLMMAVVFLDSIGFEPRMWPYIRLIYAAHTLQETPHDKMFPTAATWSGQRR